MNDYSKYQTYAKKVVNGEIISCRYVYLACQRYLNFFDNPKYEFRSDKADKVVNFIQKLKHFTGRFAGKNFILEEWQLFLLYHIFGFYVKGTNQRMIKHAILCIGRKNGKSFLASAIGLYMLIADGESGSEVYCVANSREQGNILYNMAVNIAKGMDPKLKYLIPNIKKIKFPRTNSFFQLLSSEVKTLDGLNAYCFFCDEVSAMPDTKLYDVLQSSQGMRENPLSFMTTTANYWLSYPYYTTIRKGAIEMLEGHVENDSLFALIATLDEGDDYKDENNWYKANLNLDVTVTKEFLRDRLESCKTNPSILNDFLTKNLNVWVQSSETWIKDNLIFDSMQIINLDDFKNVDKLYAIGGIDLSSVSDITCFSICFPYQEKIYFKTWCFLPEDTIEESPNRELYKKFIAAGDLIVTPGNVVDYDYVLTKIKEVNKDIKILKIAFDSWNSTQFVINATQQKLPMVPYSQSLSNFNRPTKEFERLIKSGKIIIDENALVRWAFQNVELMVDSNENMKPKKSGKNSKIDPVISMLESLGIMIESKPFRHFFEVI